MRILVTAGNTQTPIDEVRCITNIFTGRTGGLIALEAGARGHCVTLLTSHPEVSELAAGLPADVWTVRSYRTFDDLHVAMADLIPSGGFDAIVHCAAVSDYRVEGVYAPAPPTRFLPETGMWTLPHGIPRMDDVRAGKVKSTHEELWLRLTRTPKLVDFIRSDWNFRGVLVKFKLEVGVDEATLREIAEASRQQSHADLMAANTLEGMHDWALLGPFNGAYRRVTRQQLAPDLLAAVETLASRER